MDPLSEECLRKEKDRPATAGAPPYRLSVAIVDPNNDALLDAMIEFHRLVCREDGTGLASESTQ